MVKALISRKLFYTRLRFRDWKAGQQLNPVQVNIGSPRANDIILFACLRNEKPRMTYFTDYYRKLGVKHFCFVDNNSDDGFIDWAKNYDDISVWHTEASYKKSNFGMLWLNFLLTKYGRNHWCVVVDPDEFLVYPYMETRNLNSLASFLEEDKRDCMHALMLDAYSNQALEDTKLLEGQSPFDICPYFDRDGYIQAPGWSNGVWVRGGVRMRKQFQDRPEQAPSLNKIPFIKWRKGYHYRMSMHDAYPLRLNRPHAQNTVSVSGALFHFKLISTLVEKASEELHRNEHYAAGREYARYRNATEAEYFDPGISVRYQGTRQLTSLGLISPGKWF